MKKKILIGIIVFCAIIAVYTIKSEATFKITNFTINCTLKENGDMQIEENINYYTTESKNGLIRTIDTRNEMNTNNSADNIIELESVLADGVEYRKTISATVGTSGVYTLNKKGTEYEIKVFSPFNSGNKRITYIYKLRNVAVKYQDIAELYWNFIGPEWDCKIDNVRINIILPQEAGNGTIYVYGHGSDNGTFTKNKNYITLRASGLKAYQALDARILFPTSAISQSTKIVNKSVLDKYINEEEGITAKKEQPQILFELSVAQIAMGTSVLILIIGIYIYFRYDKEYSVQKYRYYREIPYDLEPEVLQRIYYGSKTKKSFWITFLNLVKKGVFTIEKTTNEVGRETEKILFGKSVKNLKEHQKLVRDIIKGCMGSGKNEITLLELQAKIKTRTSRKFVQFNKSLESEVQALFGETKKAPKGIITILAFGMIALILLITTMSLITAKGEMEGFGIAMSLGMTALVYSIFFAVAGRAWPVMIFLLFHCSAFQAANIGMLVSAGIGWMYIPYALLFILIQYVVRVRKASKEERQIIEQLKGLRRYLKDYSLLSEKEDVANLAIWEDYLIMAIALGLNEKIINDWYEYGQIYMDSNLEKSFYNMGGYTHIRTNIMPVFQSYSTMTMSSGSSSGSSYSGSSGGFSGGSSSGGGGRRRRRRKFVLIKRSNKMRLHYKGKFDGNVDELPSGELQKHENAIKFKEIDDVKKLMIVMNSLAGVVAILLWGVYCWRSGGFLAFNWMGIFLGLLTLFPHEILHAICFKGDVDMYLADGGAFVCGIETMSKFRFVFMSLLPNIIFGFIPFIIFLIFPEMTILGTLGLMGISMGVGDYYNVFNSLTQMPKRARCFMEKQNSYWYMP